LQDPINEDILVEDNFNLINFVLDGEPEAYETNLNSEDIEIDDQTEIEITDLQDFVDNFESQIAADEVFIQPQVNCDEFSLFNQKL
jgi:hypothetical protein